jgi:hypothetical protein
MKFIRRQDLTPHTRIDIVRLAWLNQGIYGKMTQIAQDYHISRTWLYQLMGAANLQLETLFSAQKPCVEPVWSKNSCGFTFVVFEEASKPFATPNRACMFCILADTRKEQDIPFPLMVSLVMIMHQVFFEGAT